MSWSKGKIVLILVAMTGGCEPEPPAQGAPTPTEEPLRSFDEMHERVLLTGCATGGCHTSDALAGNLDLSTPDAAYEALILQPPQNNVANENGWKLVLPGNAEGSFLIRKLTGPGVGEGEAMPSRNKALHPYWMDQLISWIEEGAER